MDLPPRVPPAFWSDPAIQAALAQRHIGKLIAAYRNHPAHARTVRQQTVAEWAGISQVQLSRIESGRPVTDLDRLTHWARVLRIPPDLLWFQLPGHHRSRQQPPPTIALPSQGPFRLVQVGAHASAIDAAQVFRSADSSIGGGHLYSEVLAYLHTAIGPQLFGGDPATDSTVVFTAAAGLTEMAGWMSHDAGNDIQALVHFTRARDLSRLGGDRELHVHVLASLSHLALHNDRPDLAIRHAYDGEMELSKGPRHPELLARLFAMQARAAAMQQRPRDALGLLDRAATTLATGSDTPPSAWVSRFDEAALASESSRCRRQLGDLAGAAAHAERIIALRPVERARSRAFGNLTLAEVLIDQRNLDRACAIIETVITTTPTLGSYLVLRRLTDIHELLQPFRTAAVVRDLLETLAAALATRQHTWIHPSPHAHWKVVS